MEWNVMYLQAIFLSHFFHVSGMANLASLEVEIFSCEATIPGFVSKL